MFSFFFCNAARPSFDACANARRQKLDEDIECKNAP